MYPYLFECSIYAHAVMGIYCMYVCMCAAINGWMHADMNVCLYTDMSARRHVDVQMCRNADRHASNIMFAMLLVCMYADLLYDCPYECRWEVPGIQRSNRGGHSRGARF